MESMLKSRTAAWGAAALLAAGLGAGSTAAASSWGSSQPSTAKAPKAGSKYTGKTVRGANVVVRLGDKKTVYVIGWGFDCKGGVTGNASLNDITIKRAKNGNRAYKFAIRAYSSADYSDDFHENVHVILWAKFSSDAKRITGHVRVHKAPHCGDTGEINFSATRD
jgi:hypothetical protein